MATSPPEPCGRRLYAELGHGSTHKRFIVDSGASLHLADSRTLTNDERKHVRRLRTPLTLQTANGTIVIEKYKRVWVVEVEVFVEAVILKNCSPVVFLRKN